MTTNSVPDLVLPPAPEALSIYVPHSPPARRAHAARRQEWLDECNRLRTAHAKAVEEASKPQQPTEDALYQTQLREYQRQQDAALQRAAAEEFARQQHADFLASIPAVVDVTATNPVTWLEEIQHRTRQGYRLLPHTVEIVGFGLFRASFELDPQPTKKVGK